MRGSLQSLLLFLSLFTGLAIPDSVGQRPRDPEGVKTIAQPTLEDPYRNERLLENGEAPVVTLTRGKQYKVEVQGPKSRAWYVVVAKPVRSGNENYWMNQLIFSTSVRKDSKFSADNFDQATVTVWIEPPKLEQGDSWPWPVPYSKGSHLGSDAYALEFKDKAGIVKVTVSAINGPVRPKIRSRAGPRGRSHRPRSARH